MPPLWKQFPITATTPFRVQTPSLLSLGSNKPRGAALLYDHNTHPGESGPRSCTCSPLLQLMLRFSKTLHPLPKPSTVSTPAVTWHRYGVEWIQHLIFLMLFYYYVLSYNVYLCPYFLIIALQIILKSLWQLASAYGVFFFSSSNACLPLA